jgi:hypothetical protein
MPHATFHVQDVTCLRIRKQAEPALCTNQFERQNGLLGNLELLKSRQRVAVQRRDGRRSQLAQHVHGAEPDELSLVLGTLQRTKKNMGKPNSELAMFF